MIKAYILTVESADGARYAHAMKEAIKLDMSWQFAQGVRLGDASQSREYSKLRNLLFYRRNMTPGEISVYLGHRRAWTQFLTEGVDHALILEDDFQIINREELRTAIKDALSHPGAWDIIKFFDFSTKRTIAAMDFGSTRFVYRKYPPNGAVAYLLNVPAARALLSRQRIYRPVDEDISRPWEFSLRVLSSKRNLVTEISRALGGSFLDSERIQEENVMHKNPIRCIFMRNLLELNKFIRSAVYQRMLKRRLHCEIAWCFK